MIRNGPASIRTLIPFLLNAFLFAPVPALILSGCGDEYDSTGSDEEQLAMISGDDSYDAVKKKDKKKKSTKPSSKKKDTKTTTKKAPAKDKKTETAKVTPPTTNIAGDDKVVADSIAKAILTRVAQLKALTAAARANQSLIDGNDTHIVQLESEVAVLEKPISDAYQQLAPLVGERLASQTQATPSPIAGDVLSYFRLKKAFEAAQVAVADAEAEFMTHQSAATALQSSLDALDADIKALQKQNQTRLTEIAAAKDEEERKKIAAEFQKTMELIAVLQKARDLKGQDLSVNAPSLKQATDTLAAKKAALAVSDAAFKKAQEIVKVRTSDRLKTATKELQDSRDKQRQAQMRMMNSQKMIDELTAEIQRYKDLQIQQQKLTEEQNTTEKKS